MTKYCVLIPYKDNRESVKRCFMALYPLLTPEGMILLVEDGGSPLMGAGWSQTHLLRHPVSLGPAAARNTGLEWCMEHDVDIVILLDSDCVPQSRFVKTHLRFHEDFPDVVCIGGSIQGTGGGFWARLDNIASWFTSVPGSRARVVGPLYHIPTTNMSLKLKELPMKHDFFDASLKTGEDVKFLKELRRAGQSVLFFPLPMVFHKDRQDARSVLLHQYRWGLHAYTVRCGGRRTRKRFALAAIFFLLIPAYALVCTAINLLPWLRSSAKYICWWPALFALWLYKGFGVFMGIINPGEEPPDFFKMFGATPPQQ